MTTVPKEIVDQTVFELAHGMGDPRGGEFRAAKVDVGSLWSNPDQPVEVHGWVFPPKGKMPAQIVTLDGLVYDAVAVGRKLSLVDEFAPGTNSKTDSRFGQRRGVQTIGLLLIAGEKGLAQRLAASRSSEIPTSDTSFLSSLFDQGVTAHMRGDDLLAYGVAKTIERYRPAYEKRSLALNGQRMVSGPNAQIVKTDEQFPFLNVLPDLIADTERRLQAPTRPPLPNRDDPTILARLPVAVLIDHLDEVNARQWSQPGGVSLDSDPIVAALIQIGSPAVEPLLDAMETDKRLTRSVSFFRDFAPGRNLIPVRSAAYSAFLGIADTTVFDGSSGETVDVAKLRAFWNANAGFRPVDRWVTVLKDDNAGQRRWMDAANRLFDPVGVKRFGSWTQIGNTGGPIKAEAVRSMSAPSLSDLLARRARQLCGSGSAISSQDWFACADGLRLAAMLAKWDHQGSLPTLKDTSARAMAIGVSGYSIGQTAKPLTEVLELRAKLGDRTVWPEYAAWLPKLSALEGWADDLRIFEPFARHTSEPAFAGLGQKLFLEPTSPNNPYRIATQHPGWNRAENMAITPLLVVPEFRESIFRVLDDKAVCGETSVDARGTVMTKSGGSSNGQGGDPKILNDPLRPKPTEKRPVRIADSMAKALTRLKGAPEFQPYWPTKEKDKAIASLKSFLETNGAKVDELLTWPNNWREPDFGRPASGLRNP